MTELYDALEQRDPAAREAALMAALPAHIAHAQSQTRGFARALAGIDAAAINSRSALARLPVLRKQELLEQHQAMRADPSRRGDPFGGYSAIGWHG